MAGKGKSERMKGGVVDGVAYANGKGGHMAYSKKVHPSYGGQARAKAAKSMIGKGV